MMKNEDEKVEILPNKKIVVAELKVKPTTFLKFNGMEDIKELIGFTGLRPKITVNGELHLKRWILTPPCYIERAEDNSIIAVLSRNEFKDLFTVKELKEYSKSYQALKD